MTEQLRRAYSRHTWIPVTMGLSGATVFRLEDKAARPQLFIKTQTLPSPWGTIRLADESARLVWLAERGIPVSDVVEYDADDTEEWLVTKAVPGLTAADKWDGDKHERVIDAVADIVTALHRLSVDDCPFDRALDVTVPQAEDAVAGDHVDFRPDDLDEGRRGWTAERLLSELWTTKPAAEELAVCHGDFCLPNVLLDPRTLDVTGLIDVGRLGRADRYADFALMARSIASAELKPQYAPELAGRFLRRVGADEGDGRVAFYQLLDEFS